MSVSRRKSRVPLFVLYLGAYVFSASIATYLLLARVHSDSNVATFAYDDDDEQIMSDHPISFDHPTLEVESNRSQEEEYTCDTQNSPDMLPNDDPIKRALHAVLIGAMKGGTQALHTILINGHPRILTSGKGHGELHFFNDAGLRRNTGEEFDRLRDRVIPRQEFRDAFENIISNRKRMNAHNNGTLDITNEINTNKIGIHSAPIYIFSGRKLAARLLCAAPWAKVIAILRNPIDRAFSQYNFAGIREMKNYVKHPTFEMYIKMDITMLERMGVFRDWNQTNFESFSGSEEEQQSWERYIKRAGNKGPVGRGLYAIQLEIWLDEFKKINKSPEEDLLVLQSEEAKENPKGAFDDAVEFLGLRPKRKVREHLLEDHHTTHYRRKGMSDETYNMLYALFEPYNKRLYKLLGEDTWGGVWDDR